MTDIIIGSPLRGWAAPLEEVPDPVFAERMLGDGLAIHPLDGMVTSPCDGEIVTFHAAHHAVTIRTPEGAEILIHVGLDTVALGGAGLVPRAKLGDRVRRGDPLIECDLDQVATAATSLVTPVIITNSDAFRIQQRTTESQVAAGDPLMVLRATPAAAGDVAAEGAVHRRSVIVALEHGLHARPAARIGERARRFDSDLHLVRGEARANAYSPTSLLALGIRRGDAIELEARGPDAAACIEAVVPLLEGAAEEAGEVPVTSPSAPARPRPGSSGLPGTVAAPGLALGPAARLHRSAIGIARSSGSTETERGALAAALREVRTGVARLAADATSPAASVMAAHLALLDDPELLGAAETAIAAGASAGEAWRQATGRQSELLRATGDARLIERIDDLSDIERQVLLALAGEREESAELPPGSILVARDLLPSQLAALDPSSLAGVCLEEGGPTSHVAILCAGLGIPALVCLGDALREVPDGTLLALDGDAGLLDIAPDSDAADSFSARIQARRSARAGAIARAAEECRTADGTRIELFANLGSAEDARTAVANGAEGCGLLRTEFLFLGREDAPDEDEQLSAYQKVVDEMEGRPVIARLLDIGGDKPVPYLRIAPEENPALGVRGIRVGLARPDLLDTQLRALLRVSPPGRCRIMVPMIVCLSELHAVRVAMERAAVELGLTDLPQLGVMIETPAAAIIADQLARKADFLSVGTNDLAQYALAIDRGNAAVASGLDGLHPAVLRLIGETCSRAAAQGRWTGVCGGLASDPAAIPILIGLGVTELSCVPGFVADAKAIVRRVTMQACRAHAARALDLDSAVEVRALARAFEEECGR